MTPSPVSGLTLPFRFDNALLHRDLAEVLPEEWTPHFNERDFGGEWTGLSLRSLSGLSSDLRAGNADPSEFQDTPLLSRCACIRDLLPTFHCLVKSVRLLSLAPGSFIREHSDHALGFEDGEIRIHIPIQTNPEVEFYVCGERLLLEEGNCYYVNVNLPHRVNNRGTTPRVHLVIDAVVNDWVRATFAVSGDITRSAIPPSGFREFSAHVFADESLRQRLTAIPDRAELLTAAAHEATALGFNLNEADIEAAFRADAPQSAGNSGWVPYRAEIRAGEPRATWAYLPDAPFTEPFFDDTIRVALRNPFTALFRREIPLRASGPNIAPDGIVFHMSRCGSTLISRSLAAAGLHVISEPPPLDQILAAARDTQREQGNDWLRLIVSALGPSRTNSPAPYILKADSWHIHELARFREVFPDVPWIFAYRDPREVLASHLLAPGLHMSPGAMDPSLLGMTFSDITSLTRAQWCTRVLEGFLEAAVRFETDPLALFVDYSDLPEAITGEIATLFQLDLSPDQKARVHAAARIDAKNPRQEFAGDREEKRRLAESIPSAGLDRLMALYRRLQDRRAHTASPRNGKITNKASTAPQLRGRITPIA